MFHFPLQVWFSNRRARLRKEEYYTETNQTRELSKAVHSYAALTTPTASFTRIYFPNGAAYVVPYYWLPWSEIYLFYTFIIIRFYEAILFVVMIYYIEFQSVKIGVIRFVKRRKMLVTYIFM